MHWGWPQWYFAILYAMNFATTIVTVKTTWQRFVAFGFIFLGVFALYRANFWS